MRLIWTPRRWIFEQDRSSLELVGIWKLDAVESVEELLRHLELVSEIGFGLSWTTRRPLDIEFGIGLVADGLRLVDDKMVIWN